MGVELEKINLEVVLRLLKNHKNLPVKYKGKKVTCSILNHTFMVDLEDKRNGEEQRLFLSNLDKGSFSITYIDSFFINYKSFKSIREIISYIDNKIKD